MRRYNIPFRLQRAIHAYDSLVGYLRVRVFFFIFFHQCVPLSQSNEGKYAENIVFFAFKAVHACMLARGRVLVCRTYMHEYSSIYQRMDVTAECAALALLVKRK